MPTMADVSSPCKHRGRTLSDNVCGNFAASFVTRVARASRVRPMRRFRLGVSTFFFVVLLGSPVLAQEPPPAVREAGVRGRIVVAPELQAATELPVDAARAESLRTPAHVRRARGRKVLPMMEPVPELSIVVEGEDVRADTAPPKTIVLEAMRFVPGQVLLTRPGPLAVENRQGQPITIVDGDKPLDTIPAGETRQVTLSAGPHVLSMRELPYARANVKVLERGRVLPLDANGDIPFVGFVEGDYQLSFWLGVGELHRREFSVARNGLSYIDGTVSGNTVVDVSIKDVADRIAAPQPPRPAEVATPPQAPPETP